MDGLSGIGAMALVAVVATAGTGFLIWALARWRIIDRPNQRSSHSQPTPRGGGIAVVAAIALGWLWIAVIEEGGDGAVLTILVLALLLAGVSFMDDLRGLSAATRLAAHFAAVAFGLAALPQDMLVFQGVLPGLADRLLAGLCWAWFINLFNFMDGIDGIAGTEAACLGLGTALVLLLIGRTDPLALYGLAIAVAAAGFLVWNWHPARIFLGDVGSVPLGFLLGWLLLHLAGMGLWAAALILPLYYIADATVTLALRAWRGERVWEAHREHFYQQAVRRGMSHARVSLAVFVVGLLLIVLAMAASVGGKITSLIAAIVVVAAFLRWLEAGRKPGPDA